MKVDHDGKTYYSASILGGLPVLVTVNAGYDSFTCEHWSEVTDMRWMKRNGKPGKAIPDHLWDKANAYDYGFASLLEQVFDSIAMEQDEDY